MAERVTAQRMVLAVRDGVGRRQPDHLAVEEPLEIRVNGEPVAVTMRTPGHDYDLALGFCLTGGIADGVADVATISYCPGGAEENLFNVLDVRRRDPAPVGESLRRNVYTSSSCGVCGTSSIEAVRQRVPDVSADDLTVTTDLLASLPARLRTDQRVFARTGGLHAAALFDRAGDLVCIREDIGRHNAVDKVIGWAAGESLLPLSGHLLVVSGRVAFEIAQKALIAGLPLLVAISAPSSLAVSLAEESGMTIVGFLRGASMNVYSHPHRVVVSAGPGPAADGPAADDLNPAPDPGP